ncbi:hypothetical protein JMA_32480 [Jeotgalibacillus malaysiensis]|uniref:Uncharacterized protein n=1 Tax=Jeotgalibacillus malaysiensis TaxID=1508404 RepID=A0A0B5AQL7_9BACL|nr:hypothetical protein [Jeotgalibacillus malaysiensis]AJD92565.1 hypothetical protein JMA_32480 [Jeotgalibacillus malaysiensis]
MKLKILQIAAQIAAVVFLVNVGFMLWGDGGFLSESVMSALIALLMFTYGAEYYVNPEHGRKTAYSFFIIGSLILGTVLVGTVTGGF